MTKETAIDVLRHVKARRLTPKYTLVDRCEAIDLAISALKGYIAEENAKDNKPVFLWRKGADE